MNPEFDPSSLIIYLPEVPYIILHTQQTTVDFELPVIQYHIQRKKKQFEKTKAVFDLQRDKNAEKSDLPAPNDYPVLDDSQITTPGIAEQS